MLVFFIHCIRLSNFLAVCGWPCEHGPPLLLWPRTGADAAGLRWLLAQDRGWFIRLACLLL